MKKSNKYSEMVMYGPWKLTLLAICTLMVREVCLADEPLKVITTPNVPTHRLGGVDVPNAEMLKQLHTRQYILRASGGKLTKIAAKRTLLPHSNSMSPQSVQVDLARDGTVYVRQPEILCKSSDGGGSWTARPIKTAGKKTLGFRWKVLRDGTFICVGCSTGKDARDPAIVWVSEDEGQTWIERAKIPIKMNLPTGRPYAERYVHRGLSKLRDDTLLWFVDIRDDPFTDGHALFTFRSTDGGFTWSDPSFVHDWGSEGGATTTSSGRVFATLRYQRQTLASDLADIEKRNRSISPGWCWKHVFVMDSNDGGRTWSTPRQLTTVFGQTFGYPAAQSDDTIVVIHDTRYGPGPPGSRAMISRDEGKTWLDEVYYLDHTAFTGSYSASVVLKDDTILTIAGSSQAGNSWEAVKDKTDLYAIRWKPVKD